MLNNEALNLTVANFLLTLSVANPNYHIPNCSTDIYEAAAAVHKLRERDFD